MAKAAFILVAALGMTAFAAVGGFMYGTSNYPELERYPPYHEASQDRPDADRAISAQQPKAERDKQPCRNPESREESDLCAQWVAADAARRNTLWTKRQFWIGVVTALGLALTLLLTYRAVRASEKGVIAAQATTNAYIALERPQLVPVVQNCVQLEPGGPILVVVGAENIGKSVGYVHRIGSRPSAHNGPPGMMALRPTGTAVYPQQTVTVGTADSADDFHGEPYVSGQIVYRSAFKEDHVSYFCFRVEMHLEDEWGGPEPVAIKERTGANWPKDT